MTDNPAMKKALIMECSIGVRPPYDFLKENGSEIKES